MVPMKALIEQSTDSELIETAKLLTKEAASRDGLRYPAGRLRSAVEAEIAVEVGKQFYESGDKPMKAMLLLHESDKFGNTWTAGDQSIEISSSENLAKEVFDWMAENGVPRAFLRNVYYDGMLFEYTSKPVLAEVGTGIEI